MSSQTLTSLTFRPQEIAVFQAFLAADAKKTRYFGPESATSRATPRFSTVFSTGVENSGKRPNVHGITAAEMLRERTPTVTHLPLD
jgi:hypothetical protein